MSRVLSFRRLPSQTPTLQATKAFQPFTEVPELAGIPPVNSDRESARNGRVVCEGLFADYRLELARRLTELNADVEAGAHGAPANAAEYQKDLLDRGIIGAPSIGVPDELQPTFDAPGLYAEYDGRAITLNLVTGRSIAAADVDGDKAGGLLADLQVRCAPDGTLQALAADFLAGLLERYAVRG